MPRSNPLTFKSRRKYCIQQPEEHLNGVTSITLCWAGNGPLQLPPGRVHNLSPHTVLQGGCPPTGYMSIHPRTWDPEQGLKSLARDRVAMLDFQWLLCHVINQSVPSPEPHAIFMYVMPGQEDLTHVGFVAGITVVCQGLSLHGLVL